MDRETSDAADFLEQIARGETSEGEASHALGGYSEESDNDADGDGMVLLDLGPTKPAKRQRPDEGLRWNDGAIVDCFRLALSTYGYEHGKINENSNCLPPTSVGDAKSKSVGGSNLPDPALDGASTAQQQQQTLARNDEMPEKMIWKAPIL